MEQKHHCDKDPVIAKINTEIDTLKTRVNDMQSSYLAIQALLNDVRLDIRELKTQRNSAVWIISFFVPLFVSIATAWISKMVGQ